MTYFDEKLYELVDRKKLLQTGQDCLVLSHRKTGAHIMLLPCQDENKMFGIAFKTIPSSSKGEAHIVEHSVLSGGKKYRTKEPFMDLLNTSMQTYLNAITYADFTVYPVASKNEKDLYNLADVYLDGIFFPYMYENKNIFLQEAWRYELYDADAPLKVNGIVYNEMSAWYASPDEIVSHQISRALNGNGSYSFDSGGIPEFIIDLSYDDFKDFHKRHYHPSNSYICLYGNLDTKSFLDFLDRDYLSKFEHSDADFKAVIDDFKGDKILTEAVPMEGENSDKGCQFSYSVVYADHISPEEQMDRYILDRVLIADNASKLRKNLLESGICDDCYGMIKEGDVMNYGFIAKNCKKADFDRFINIVESTLQGELKTGLDKKLLNSIANSLEFYLRDVSGSRHRGKTLFVNALMTWIHDSKAYAMLNIESIMSDIRKKINSGYYEYLLEDRIINNEKKKIICHTPDPLYEEKVKTELEKRLADIKSKLSKEEIADIIKEQKELIERINTKDDEEAKKSIPSLKLDEIDFKFASGELIEKKMSDYDEFFSPANCSGIVYAELLFPFEDESIEKLHLLSLMSRLLTNLDTENYKYEELSTEINSKLGGLSFGNFILEKQKPERTYKTFFRANSKCLSKNIDSMVSLLYEIVSSSKFDSKDRIKELVSIIKTSMESDMYFIGDSIAVSEILSRIDRISAVDGELNGLGFYFYIKELYENFDARFDELKNELQLTLNEIINKSGLKVHICSDRSDYTAASNAIKSVVDKIDAKERLKSPLKFIKDDSRHGITIPGNVHYVAQCFKMPGKYDSRIKLAASLLNGIYLHENVRGKGGAYGVGFRQSSNMLTSLSSYRDPQIKMTLETYDGIPNYLRNLQLSDDEFEKTKISTINGYNPALHISAKCSGDFIRRLISFTDEEINEEIEAIKNAKLEDIRAFADSFEEGLKSSVVSILGSEEKIKTDGNVDKLMKLL